jgi:hypothetical protein
LAHTRPVAAFGGMLLFAGAALIVLVVVDFLERSTKTAR